MFNTGGEDKEFAPKYEVLVKCQSGTKSQQAGGCGSEGKRQQFGSQYLKMNHPEDLLKHPQLGSPPKESDFVGPWWGL